MSRSNEAWEVVTYYLSRGWFLAACPSVDDASSGLVVEHAYSILGYVQEGDIRLCRLRNPWGSGEWRGQWSGSDGKTWNAHPELKKKCGEHFVDDGVFWMTIEDVITRFRNFHCHAVRPDIDRESHEHSTFRARSESATTGGSDSDDEPQAIVGEIVPSQMPIQQQGEMLESPLSVDEECHTDSSPSRPALQCDNHRVLSKLSLREASDRTRVSKLSPFANMRWLTIKQCWQESYSELSRLEKAVLSLSVREAFHSKFEGCPEQVSEAGHAMMSPLDCPQYALEVPAGELCELEFRAVRKSDTDGDGIDDDEDPDFDPVDEAVTADCTLPQVYLVRGSQRLHTLPTKFIACSRGSFSRATLKPGTYILMVMVFHRAEMPLKLVTRSKARLSVTQLPKPLNVVAVRGDAIPALGAQLGALLQAANSQTKPTPEEVKRDPVGHAFATRYLCHPSTFAMKKVHLALLLDHQFDFIGNSGSFALGCSRTSLTGASFQWSSFQDYAMSTTTVCSFTARGSGNDFHIYPFFTGLLEKKRIPFAIVAWGEDPNATVSPLALTALPPPHPPK